MTGRLEGESLQQAMDRIWRECSRLPRSPYITVRALSWRERRRMVRYWHGPWWRRSWKSLTAASLWRTLR